MNSSKSQGLFTFRSPSKTWAHHINYLMALVLTVFCLRLSAQISGIVKYSKTIVDNNVPLECSAELVFDGKKSKFTSNVGTYPGKYVKYQGKESELYMDEKGNQVVKDYKRSKLFLRENVISSAYVSEEATPVFGWHLTGDHRKILGFRCLKATTFFRGRNYVAWYASDIAISEGPWKFYGLPGLILEIYDDKKEVIFRAFEIKIPSKISKITGLTTRKSDKKVSIDQFRRAYDIEVEHWTNVSKAESEGVDDFEIEWNKRNTIELSFEEDQKNES